MSKQHILILVLVIFLVIVLTFHKPIKKGIENMTRGYKNRNPGNIEKTTGFWKGEIQGTDKRFKTFINMEHGYRAIFVLLRGYIDKGFDTIEKIINRYAPPSENVTSSYVTHVSKIAGISKDEKINFSDTQLLKKIVAGISEHENGIKPEMNLIEKGYNLFLSL
jgi:hypothetical protein